MEVKKLFKWCYTFTKRYAYAMFLGGGMASLGFGIDTWQCWVGIIGMTALVAWRES